MSRHVTRMELPRWPGYSVSSDGYVYGPKGVLKPALTCSYYRVTLCRGTKDRKNFHVHRLVLEAFVGPSPEGEEARHLDGDRTNNDLSNLCWSTRVVNARDRITHGTQVRGTLHGRSKLTEEIVAEARRLNKSGIGSDRLSVRYGVSRPTMWDAISGKTWTHVVQP
jgi:hypothetical protein